jgi:cell division protein FtsB
VTLPEKGYQKIIKSDGTETIVEVASSGHDVTPHDLAAENKVLREENSSLKDKVIDLQDQLLGKK